MLILGYGFSNGWWSLISFMSQVKFHWVTNKIFCCLSNQKHRVHTQNENYT